jgi:hypothetical protein
MSKPNLSADVAAFLARGGAIQKIAPGECTDTIQRLREEDRARERGVVFDRTAQRVDAGYAVFNGQGEALYLGA